MGRQELRQKTSLELEVRGPRFFPFLQWFGVSQKMCQEQIETGLVWRFSERFWVISRWTVHFEQGILSGLEQRFCLAY